MSELLELDQVTLSYGNSVIVDSFSLSVGRGETASLLGPSGVGKTTLLRAIAGFHPLDSGEIQIDGKVVSRQDYHLEPEKRKLGMVFQDFALFPHLTVAQNVAIGLRKLPKSERVKRVRQMLERLSINNLAERYPHQISGGQQQRVAVARALVPRPELILMDEPFSNLDVETHEQVVNEIRELFAEQETTSILVTHHQQDAFSFSNRIAVVYEGKLLQWDTPYRIYHEPSSRFVADFIGEGVFLPGLITNQRNVQTELGVINGHKVDYPAGAQVDVLIRPDDIVVDDDSEIQLRIVRKEFRGSNIMYTLRLSDGKDVLSLAPSHSNYSVGEFITVRLDAEHVVAFRD